MLYVLSSCLDRMENIDYILHMEIANMKVRRQTLKRLKLLAALEEDTMMNVLDRLVEAALARIEAERQKGGPDAGHAGL